MKLGRIKIDPLAGATPLGIKLPAKDEPLYPEDDGRVSWVGQLTDVSGVEAGMASGNPAVLLRIEIPDIIAVGAETPLILYSATSLRLFLTAADALKARYGDPR